MSDKQPFPNNEQTGTEHAPTPSGVPPQAELATRAGNEDATTVSRRWLLLKAGIAVNGAVGLALAIPLIRYFFGPMRSDDSYKSWVTLGPAESFPEGETRLAYYKNPFRQAWDGVTDNVACYVRREGANNFRVFAVNCAHLGCPVRWFSQSQLFMCPCHGGVYYADGSRASGPPERGLFTYPWKVVSGQLQIDAGQMPTLSNTAKLVNISTGGNSPCQG